MKALIATWGSRGDFQPYLALAAAFQKGGHEVRLAAQPSAQFRDLAAAHGVAFTPLGPDNEADFLDTANQAISAGDPAASARVIIDRLFAPALDGMFQDCLELARWSDVVVSHALQVTGAISAEAAGRPCVTGALVPTQIPQTGKSNRRLPSLRRRATTPSESQIAEYKNGVWLPLINRVRRRAGLPEVQDLTEDGFYSRHLNLVPVSPTVFARPPGWPPQHCLTGYWRLGAPKGWMPSANLLQFLEAGGPVVAVGFGSMTSEDSHALTSLLAEAIDRAEVRAILEPGMAGLGAPGGAKNILVAGDVPHAWLLPRVAALVHHGGAGTTGAAFHAGIPAVVAPHVFDQFFWAERARQLGVAPAPAPLNAFTAPALATAIRTAVSDGKMRDRARRIGDDLGRERGAETAVRLIEEYVAHNERPHPARPMEAL